MLCGFLRSVRTPTRRCCVAFLATVVAFAALEPAEGVVGFVSSFVVDDMSASFVGTGDGQLVRSRVNITSWSLSGIQSCDWISDERYFRFMCEEKLDVLCRRTLMLNSTSSLGWQVMKP